jgi:hypothetical protein
MTEPATVKLAGDLTDWEYLARPFTDSQIGKLPRISCGACRDTRAKVCDQHRKQKCDVCDNWISTAHIHLDYVGHAQVTARLLEVDPDWNWEPVGWDVDGMPAILVEQGGRRVMWIKLTVLGVTRLGVGIAGSGEEVEKVLIGDALRNAAMRFGVALDLWAKGDLHGEDAPPAPSARVPDQPDIDWVALGWMDKEHHDDAWEACKHDARRLPEPHHDNVKEWVKEEGDGPPYSKRFMDAWDEMMGLLTEDEGRPFTDDDPLPAASRPVEDTVDPTLLDP